MAGVPMNERRTIATQAAEVSADFATFGVDVLGIALEPGASFTRWLFLDPDARCRIVNWADFAAAAVGAMRYELGRRPDDRRLAHEVEDLRRSDPDVARWWDDHGVTDRTSVTKRIDHPPRGRSPSGSRRSSCPTTPTSASSSTPSTRTPRPRASSRCSPGGVPTSPPPDDRRAVEGAPPHRAAIGDLTAALSAGPCPPQRLRSRGRPRRC